MKGKSKVKTPKKQSRLRIRLFKFLALLIAVGVIAMGLLVLAVFNGVFGELPSNKQLRSIRNHTASEVVSADGQVMGRYYLENRVSIDNQKISVHVVNALVATEDARFFEHKGIDKRSLARVILKTILLGQRSEGGGSTISQQLARNLFPRQYYGVLSMPVSKLKESIIAVRLNQIYSKDEILNLYLNTVSFGENIYGIETAAQRYFSKHSADLNEKEAATLIGMLAANTAYNPRLHPELSKKRRNVVLKRMQAKACFSQSVCERLQASPLDIKYRRIDDVSGPAPYFRAHLRTEVEQLLAENFGTEYNLYTDGLRIVTSLDSRLQHYAEAAVNEHMQQLQQEFRAQWKGRDPWSGDYLEQRIRKTPRYHAMKKQGFADTQIDSAFRQAVPMVLYDYDKGHRVEISPRDSVRYYLKMLNTGCLAVNPHTGHVLAWVGGINYKYFQYDHVLSARQVGSTFKPLVYAAALEAGHMPCEYISNERKVYEEYQDWSPRNSNGNYEGYFTLRGGLMKSVNTITAELMIQTGIEKVLELAQRMGIRATLPVVPSIALGTASIPLYEMVQAYGSFAAGGQRHASQYLLRIEDHQGHVLLDFSQNTVPVEVLDPSTNQLMVHLMESVVDSGTARALRRDFRLKGGLAGKTGTTQNHADGWFIGYTPDVVAGVWVGGENPQVRFQSLAYGSGSHMALPVFGRFLQKVYSDPAFAHWEKHAFPPLDEDLLALVDCPSYSLEDPEKGLLDSIKDTIEQLTGADKRRIDEGEKKKQQARDARAERRKKRKEKGNFFQRLFGGKKK